MTTTRAVVDALQDATNGLCDGCLVKVTGSTDAVRVRGKLGREGKVVRRKSYAVECDRCLSAKMLNRLAPMIEQKNQPAKAQLASSGIGINQLDELRRELIAHLNTIDVDGERTGFGSRVTQMRKSEQIPQLIASLMLTHGAYRNALYYTAHKLSDGETRMLQELDTLLRNWIASSKKVDSTP